jgi:hypothetical protein
MWTGSPGTCGKVGAARRIVRKFLLSDESGRPPDFHARWRRDWRAQRGSQRPREGHHREPARLKAVVAPAAMRYWPLTQGGPMKTRWTGTFIVAFCSLLLAGTTAAQKGGAAAPPPPAMGRAMISIYRIAPGKHVEFLKWLAERDAVAKEAGAAPTQLYAHMDGASWDFITIEPQLEPVAQAELGKKIEAASKKKGLTTGPKQSIEVRQFFAEHTDTMAAGPMSPQQAVDAVTK